MSRFNVDFCYTCLKICTATDKLVSLSVESLEEITYRKKLKSCVPEMILQNSEDCFLCVPCSEALETAYNFRTMCLSTEYKLREYRALQQQNLKEICSVREDLLQILSKEIIEKENPAVTTARELGELLSETVIKQEPNCAVRRTTELTNDELISRACKRLPRLRNISEAAFKCQVSLEKIVVKNVPVIVPSSTGSHIKKGPFTCNICNIVIKKRERFYCHMLKHSNIRGYKCDECKAAYFSADSLRHHRKKTHLRIPEAKSNKVPPKIKLVTHSVPDKKKKQAPPEPKRQVPPEPKCILKIKLPQKIKKVRLTNNSLEKVFRCNYCDYHTTSKSLHDRHTMKHSGGCYSCALCPKIFFTQNELTRHIQNVHNITPTKRKPKKMPSPIPIKQEVSDDEIVCTLCLERFASEPEYKIHLKTHTQIIEQQVSVKKKKKKFFCTVCSFEFSSRDHANIHTGSKPYTCNVCNKTFAASGTLRKHRYTHSEVTKSKPKKIECRNCKQEFLNNKDLSAHDCQTSSGESVYQCQICKDAYVGRTALIDHMRIHVQQNGN